MTNHYHSAPSGPHGTLRARPPTLRDSSRSRSPSHHRRASDDLLSKLTPSSVVEALQNPTGPLKACLDRATSLEQTFALKTAVASKTIHDWLEELSSWPWPPAGSSNGFELPPAKKRKLLEPETHKDNHTTSHSDMKYFGSIAAEHIVQYERRIEQIKHEMEGLHLEEIKNQVLHNHILPLSRSDIPFSDSGRSSSSYSFSKMEDLTAVVTTITVQTLPTLSKLTRLLHIWHLRLVVLRKVPSLLMMITDAEVALRSGWNAIQASSHSSVDHAKGSKSIGSRRNAVSQRDVDAMKGVIEQKVSRPGQDLDFMLDVLEGMVDSLPDEWLDRMELVERDYAKWITAAERKVKEDSEQCSKLASRDDTYEYADPKSPRPNTPMEDVRPTGMPTYLGNSDPEPSVVRILVDGSREDSHGVSEISDLPKDATLHIAESGMAVDDVPLGWNRGSLRTPKTPSAPLQTKTANNSSSPTYGGSEDGQDDGQNLRRSQIAAPEVGRKVASQSPNQLSKHDALLKPPFEDDFEPSVLESVNEEDEELELPPMYTIVRKSSRSSVSSTGPRRLSDHSTAEYDCIAYEPFSSGAISPPSSPQKRQPGSSRIAPEVSNSSPRGLLGPPVDFDPDFPFEWGTPNRMSPNSATSDDDQLQRQLRELLESIPAKIDLQKRGINLNPPDFQMPPRQKHRLSDASRRPTSVPPPRADSRLSRSATPSFMLAPVRETRARSMSSQGIQLYHLSRSGELPIKLFIRCVGEQNERVMVRVGGGWSDLGEYLREYAFHHGSRSKGEGKVTVTDAVPIKIKRPGSSLDSRPSSALNSPITPLSVQRTRKNSGDEALLKVPNTPLSSPLSSTPAGQENENTPSEASVSGRSRSSSYVDWDEEDSALGLAGPKATRRKDISAESLAWIESVKAKVRLASTERMPKSTSSEKTRTSHSRGRKKTPDDKFGEMGKAGTTKRLFRKK